MPSSPARGAGSVLGAGSRARSASDASTSNRGRVADAVEAVEKRFAMDAEREAQLFASLFAAAVGAGGSGRPTGAPRHASASIDSGSRRATATSTSPAPDRILRSPALSPDAHVAATAAERLSLPLLSLPQGSLSTSRTHAASPSDGVSPRLASDNGLTTSTPTRSDSAADVDAMQRNASLGLRVAQASVWTGRSPLGPEEHEGEAERGSSLAQSGRVADSASSPIVPIGRTTEDVFLSPRSEVSVRSNETGWEDATSLAASALNWGVRTGAAGEFLASPVERAESQRPNETWLPSGPPNGALGTRGGGERDASGRVGGRESPSDERRSRDDEASRDWTATLSDRASSPTMSASSPHTRGGPGAGGRREGGETPVGLMGPVQPSGRPPIPAGRASRYASFTESTSSVGAAPSATPVASSGSSTPARERPPRRSEENYVVFTMGGPGTGAGGADGPSPLLTAIDPAAALVTDGNGVLVISAVPSARMRTRSRSNPASPRFVALPGGASVAAASVAASVRPSPAASSAELKVAAGTGVSDPSGAEQGLSASSVVDPGAPGSERRADGPITVEDLLLPSRPGQVSTHSSRSSIHSQRSDATQGSLASRRTSFAVSTADSASAELPRPISLGRADFGAGSSLGGAASQAGRASVADGALVPRPLLGRSRRSFRREEESSRWTPQELEIMRLFHELQERSAQTAIFADSDEELDLDFASDDDEDSLLEDRRSAVAHALRATALSLRALRFRLGARSVLPPSVGPPGSSARDLRASILWGAAPHGGAGGASFAAASSVDDALDGADPGWRARSGTVLRSSLIGSPSVRDSVSGGSGAGFSGALVPVRRPRVRTPWVVSDSAASNLGRRLAAGRGAITVASAEPTAAVTAGTGPVVRPRARTATATEPPAFLAGRRPTEGSVPSGPRGSGDATAVADADLGEAAALRPRTPPPSLPLPTLISALGSSVSEAAASTAAASAAASSVSAEFETDPEEDETVRVAVESAVDGTVQVDVTVPAGLYDLLPEELVDVPIPVRPLLFTQGINEQQSFVNAVDSSAADLQRSLNLANLFRLTQFAREWGGFAVGAGVRKLDRDLAALAAEIRAENISGGKHPRVLQLAGDIVRMLHGSRLTCCKSGKDRTGMSVTLEEARLLQQRHGLSRHRVGETASLLREHGVRLAICRKNIGRSAYAFNAFQSAMLPKEYKPPSNTLAHGKVDS